MNRATLRAIGVSLAILLMVSGSLLVLAYDLSWYTVAAGGGDLSGGDYELTATIGQPAAGVTLAGGDYSLRGGFWPGVSVTPSPKPDVPSLIDVLGELDSGDGQSIPPPP